MSQSGPFDPDAAYMYDVDDRRSQLIRLQRGCAELVQLFKQRGLAAAQAYQVVADGATRLLSDPEQHAELKLLVGRLPAPPPWLHPKLAEYNMKRDAWMVDVAAHRSDVDQAVLELRALGTYDRP